MEVEVKIAELEKSQKEKEMIYNAIQELKQTIVDLKKSN